MCLSLSATTQGKEPNQFSFPLLPSFVSIHQRHIFFLLLLLLVPFILPYLTALFTVPSLLATISNPRDEQLSFCIPLPSYYGRRYSL